MAVYEFIAWIGTVYPRPVIRLESYRPPRPAQRRADELAYDPDHQLVLMAWDDDLDLFIALISVSSNPNNINVVKQIYFKSPNPLNLPCPIGGCSTGGIEQPVYDHATRKFYLAVPASEGHPNGEIAVIDPVSKEVVGAFDATGTGPGNWGALFPTRFGVQVPAESAAGL